MKVFVRIITGMGIILIATGIFGVITKNNDSSKKIYNGERSISNTNNKAYRNGNTYRGMMSGEFRSNYYNEVDYDGEKLTLKDLEENINRYVSQYNTKLKISDVFVYENSDYYYSIIEEKTGRGAMELLVNPYTGVVYPEFGPNMMWNLKYGMHYNSGRGMMGHGGMRRGNYNYGYYNNDFDENNDITKEDAYTIGNKYVDKIFENITISKDSHEFYGYYTFHLEKDGVTVGMLSVNGFTGDVWYHDWHGELKEILNEH
ncbi:hypothetical protein SH2C18_13640 [Clostridium sediminicola]|uniref:hypothetical protein n=1 Tax=Clostridium sediminicola TaxID=3114879 RepID=UPI0031F1CE0B